VEGECHSPEIQRRSSALSRGEANKERDNGRKNATGMQNIESKKKKNGEKTKFLGEKFA